MADQGNLNAMINLANLNYMGRPDAGVERNLNEATRYYQRAALQGDTTSMYNMGVLYLNNLIDTDTDIDKYNLTF